MWNRELSRTFLVVALLFLIFSQLTLSIIREPQPTIVYAQSISVSIRTNRDIYETTPDSLLEILIYVNVTNIGDEPLKIDVIEELTLPSGKKIPFGGAYDYNIKPGQTLRYTGGSGSYWEEGTYILTAYVKKSGTEIILGQASTTFKVVYKKPKEPSTISISVSPSSVIIGGSITVSGAISPAHTATVTLTYITPSGSTLVRTVSSDSSGSYKDIYKPDKVGLWSVKTSWGGDEDHYGATSDTISFTVEEFRPMIVIELSTDRRTLLDYRNTANLLIEVKNAGNDEAKNVRLNIKLPAGIMMSQGSNTWTGNLLPGQGTQITLSIFANRVGTHSIVIEGSYEGTMGQTYTFSSSLKINVKDLVLVEDTEPATTINISPELFTEAKDIWSAERIIASAFAIHFIKQASLDELTAISLLSDSANFINWLKALYEANPTGYINVAFIWFDVARETVLLNLAAKGWNIKGININLDGTVDVHVTWTGGFTSWITKRILELYIEFVKEGIRQLKPNFGAAVLRENQHKLYLKIYDNKGNFAGFDPISNTTVISTFATSYFDDGSGTITIIFATNMTSFRVVVDASFAREQVENYTLILMIINKGEVTSLIEESKNIVKGDTFQRVYEVQDSQKLIIPEIVLIDQALSTSFHCSVGSFQKVAFHAIWNSNSSSLRGGMLYVNGTAYSINQTGWVEFPVSHNEVCKIVWTVTGVTVNNITTFENLAKEPYIIWDRIKIIGYNISKGRCAIGSIQKVNVSLVYEYDGKPFSGTVYLNGTKMNYDLTRGVWYLPVTENNVGKYVYRVSGILDDLYGLTILNDPTPLPTIIFDGVKITSFSLKPYFLGLTQVDVTLKYIYDGSPVEDAKVMVNNIEAEYLGGGLYQVIITDYMPMVQAKIRVEIVDFPTQNILTSTLQTWNTITYTLLFAASLFIILFMAKKCRKRTLNSNHRL